MNLEKLTIAQIFGSYDLPHKFLVKFALFCANDVKHLLKDQRSLKALEVIELWLEDKATINEVKYAANAANAANVASNTTINTTGTRAATYAAADTANAAYTTYAAYAAANAAHAASNAAYAAYAAANATYASNAAAYAASHATYAASHATYAASYADTYKPKLISMINELTLLEQELYRR